MPTEMYTAILSALVGGICTLIITLIAIKIQRGKKIVEYNVVSMPLFRFKPIEGTLVISVDKYILTNKEIDKGTTSEIDSAYGFQIELCNVGNEDIENPNIEISLDKSAKIVGYEILPMAKPGYDIKLLKDNLNHNIIRFQVSYINRNSRLTIRLISTENIGKECKVDVIGLGIRTRKYSSIRNNISLIVITLLPILILLILNFVVPNSFVMYIGGYYDVNHISRYPLWMHVIEWMLVAVSLLGFYLMAFKGSSEKEEFEWDEPKKKGR